MLLFFPKLMARLDPLEHKRKQRRLFDDVCFCQLKWKVFSPDDLQKW
jgi:hypothetical protein